MDDNTETQETNKWLELAKQGKDVWNAWAEEELKKPIEERESIDFSKLNIHKINFSYFIFPNIVTFQNSAFSGETSFINAQFNGICLFRDAMFLDDTFFSNAKFSKNAFFENAKFSKLIFFDSAIFSENAYFRQANFSKFAYFRKVKFLGEETSFHSTKFCDETFFEQTVFSKKTFFDSSKFLNHCFFSESEFSKWTSFRFSQFFLSINFRKNNILGDLYFNCSEFIYISNFIKNKFSGNVFFDSCKFNDYSRFDFSKFEYNAHFSEAKIKKTLFFLGTFFEGAVYFNNIDFYYPPDFLSSNFKVLPTFINSFFYYPTSSAWNALIGKCLLPDGHARYLRLKKLATDIQDHQNELQLFAYEMKAKRFHVLKLSKPSDWLSLFLGYVYDITSNFGMSITKPAILIGFLFFTFCIIYSTIPDEDISFWNPNIRSFALANLIPTGGLQSEVRTNAIEAICAKQSIESFSGLNASCGVAEKKPITQTCSFVPQIHLMSTIQNFVGVILFFLLGLGIRNQFRIK